MLRRLRLVASLLVGGWLALSFAPPGTPGDVLDEDVRAVAPRLTELMREGLRRREPSANFVRALREETLFDGSFDWHSNVIAHWALLTIARVEGDEELAAHVLRPLTPAALEAERARLAGLDANKLITFPYDQAWLLVLLAELERHRPSPDEGLRGFRLEVEERVLAWLEATKFPENESPERLGGNRFVGFYRSWLFAWYLVRLSDPVGEETPARLAALKRERIVPHVEALDAQRTPFTWDFVWVPVLPRLVHEVDPFANEPPPYDPGEFPALPAEVSLSTVHVLGVEISRLWPLAIAAREGDDEARDLLHARWRELLARPDLWAEDFQVVTHWVPQFLWFTLWLADGRP